MTESSVKQENTKTWWEDRVQGQRLFILGAGFSAAAGVPMTGPLLADAMRRFQTECPGLFERISGYIRTCFGLDESDLDYRPLNLSEICTFLHYQELREYGGGERWSNAGSRENLSLRYFLAKEIAMQTPNTADIPELYRRFSQLLHEGDIVISFNWDTLLELSIQAVGKKYAYEILDDHIAIFKLHGSINWRLGKPDNSVVAEWQPLKEQVHFTEKLIHPESWRHVPSVLGEVEPFIVLPGFGKSFDVRRLAPFWYKPEYAFGFTHDVFIIGLSLARDDFIIRSFLLDNLPKVDRSGTKGRKIVVVNPDPLVRDNFGFLVGAKNVHFLCEPFAAKHLGLMACESSVSA